MGACGQSAYMQNRRMPINPYLWFLLAPVLLMVAVALIVLAGSVITAWRKP